jgi:hypothetical protein
MAQAAHLKPVWQHTAELMMHAHKTGKAAEVRAATGQLCCALQLDVTSALSRAWRDDWKCRRPDEVIHKGLHSSVG